jgi:aspartate/methionine/tyrosine aminotransferase
MSTSDRSSIEPFYVMEVMKAAAERDLTHGDCIHLEVGQPSTPAPEAVIAAAQRALVEERLGYTAAFGIPELRERIALHIRDTYDVSVQADEVAVTSGASAGCLLTFLAIFDPGARVGISEPGYAAYRNMVEALGGELVGIPVGAETRYVLTPQLLDAAGPMKALIVASPSNPTGTAMTPDELAAVARWCDRTGTRMISDEIYHGISYGVETPTARQFSDSAIIVQSFSKYFSMTGWRLGWLVLPQDLHDAVERLAQNLFISPPALSQRAAMAAFDGTEELERNVARFATSRAIVMQGLDEIGLPYAPPDGAFYVYADISSLSDDSRVLSARWLEELGVAVTPGTDFDPKEGHRFVRVSYSESPEDIAEAMRRIVESVRSISS